MLSALINIGLQSFSPFIVRNNFILKKIKICLLDSRSSLLYLAAAAAAVLSARNYKIISKRRLSRRPISAPRSNLEPDNTSYAVRTPESPLSGYAYIPKAPVSLLPRDFRLSYPFMLAVRYITFFFGF